MGLLWDLLFGGEDKMISQNERAKRLKKMAKEDPAWAHRARNGQMGSGLRDELNKIEKNHGYDGSNGWW